MGDSANAPYVQTGTWSTQKCLCKVLERSWWKKALKNRSLTCRISPNISSVDRMAAKTHQNGSTRHKEPSHRVEIWNSSRKGLEIHSSSLSHQIAADEELKWCGLSTNSFVFNPCFTSRLVVNLPSDEGRFLLNDANWAQLAVFKNTGNKHRIYTTLIMKFPKRKTLEHLKALGMFFFS